MAISLFFIKIIIGLSERLIATYSPKILVVALFMLFLSKYLVSTIFSLVNLWFFDSKFAISGHIHEAPGLITSDEQPVKQGELSDRLDFNPGAVYDHVGRNLKPAAGILEFKKDKARAYILNR